MSVPPPSHCLTPFFYSAGGGAAARLPSSGEAVCGHEVRRTFGERIAAFSN